MSTSSRPQSATPTLAQTFSLPIHQLTGEYGRIDAVRTAAFFGVSLHPLITAFGGDYAAVMADPASDNVQEILSSVANVIGILNDTFSNDSDAVLDWLKRSIPQLQRKTAMDLLLAPGAWSGVDQMVSGAWLGEPI